MVVVFLMWRRIIQHSFDVCVGTACIFLFFEGMSLSNGSTRATTFSLVAGRCPIAFVVVYSYLPWCKSNNFYSISAENKTFHPVYIFHCFSGSFLGKFGYYLNIQIDHARFYILPKFNIHYHPLCPAPCNAMQYFELCDVNEIFPIPGCYAAYIGSSLPTFRDNLCFTLEYETDRLSLNFGNRLLIYAK
jgi:hypothetical protein